MQGFVGLGFFFESVDFVHQAVGNHLRFITASTGWELFFNTFHQDIENSPSPGFAGQVPKRGIHRKESIRVQPVHR